MLVGPGRVDDFYSTGQRLKIAVFNVYGKPTTQYELLCQCPSGNKSVLIIREKIFLIFYDKKGESAAILEILKLK